MSLAYRPAFRMLAAITAIAGAVNVMLGAAGFGAGNERSVLMLVFGVACVALGAVLWWWARR